MKKKLGLLFIAGLLICSLTLTACRKERLFKPSSLKIDYFTQTLNWDAVENTNGYTVDTGVKQYDVKDNLFNLSQLEPGTYNIKVKALAHDKNYFRDSLWSDSVEFTKESDFGLIYRSINNNSEYEIAERGTASGAVIIPDTYNGKPVTSVGNNAFNSSGSLLTSVVIGDNVARIGAAAFYSCKNLTSVTLGKGLKSIGDSAFSFCSALPSIIIPDGVTDIGNKAFLSCRALTSVMLGSGLKIVSNDIFSGCDSLPSIIIPDNITVIGDYAFSACTALYNIRIGRGVTVIGQNAFRESGLKSITIPDNVTSIGNFAFRDCPELTTVTVGNGITGIGMGAFYFCAKLSNITIGNSVKSIGAYAFNGTAIWNKLSGVVYADKWAVGYNLPQNEDNPVPIPNLTLKENIIGIADRAFYGLVVTEKNDSGESEIIGGLKHLTIGDSVRFIGESAFAGCTLLESVNGCNGVISLGDNAFAYCTLLSDLTLGEGLKSIGAYAFYKCESFTIEAIPQSVTSIGAYAFKDTLLWTTSFFEVYAGNWLVGVNLISGMPISLKNDTVGISDQAFTDIKNLLEGVILPDGLKYIGNSAFSGCEIMTSVTVPDSVISIGIAAFMDCTGLKSATIGNGVENISDSLFFRCKELTNITLGDNITSIGFSAFYECAALIGVTIIDKITDIGDYAFYGCLGLEDLVIPDSVKTVGEHAFRLCGGLKSVAFGKGVETIGNHAFRECESLTAVNLGGKITSVSDYLFRDCVALASVTIGDSVKNIGREAFRGCTALTNITIGENVKTVDGYAFFGCTGLKNAIIGDGVTIIGDYAFHGCTGLYSIIIPANVTNIGVHAFTGNDRLTIYSKAADSPSSWHTLWNSSLRPVYWDFKISDYSADDKAQYVLQEGNAVLARYTAAETTFAVPQSVTIDGVNRRVTSIGNMAFSGAELRETVIPSGITSIGYAAFENCSRLTGIVIPKDVTNIGERVLANCTDLTEITVASGNTVYKSDLNCIIRISDNSLLAGCRTSVIPDYVTSIRDYAFYGCNGLTSIIIPQSVTSIGNKAFEKCTGLLSIVISNNITVLGDSFRDCLKLTLYTERTSPAEGWLPEWNSSLRPVVWGCTLSAGKIYVVSFVKSETNIFNPQEYALSAPYRDGCTFSGWSLSESGAVSYISENFASAPNGLRLFTIWTVL